MDWSAKRICPNGISPLRGLVRKADTSQRDSSTSWIGQHRCRLFLQSVEYVQIAIYSSSRKQHLHFRRCRLKIINTNLNCYWVAKYAIIPKITMIPIMVPQPELRVSKKLSPLFRDINPTIKARATRPIIISIFLILNLLCKYMFFF